MTDFDSMDDQRLAVLARDEHAAFETLYRRHVTAVYRYCFTRTLTQADAEDVTAQTFLTALESIGRYRARGPFLGWLFGIARHKCADVHRGNRNYSEMPLQEAAAFHASPGTPPEEAANSALLLDCVERMMTQLSPDRREALQLRYWGGLSLKEVAAAMDRSVAAIKMLVSRGIADLRKRCIDA